jgi:hypothetical protein
LLAKLQQARAKSAKASKPQKQVKPTTKGPSKKQKIIDENNARMLKVSLDKASRKMDVTKKQLEKLDDVDKIDLLDETLVKVCQDAELVMICHWYEIAILMCI